MNSFLELPVTPNVTKLVLPEDAAETSTIQGIGLVVPFDFALDAECWRWMPDGVPLYITRTPPIGEAAVTVELARQVSDEAVVAEAVRSLQAVRPTVVAYGCTSGSFVGGQAGEDGLRQAMEAAGAPVAVTSSGSLISALRQLEISRLAVATPYNESLTRALNSFLQEAGVTVVSSGYLDKEEGIARISYDTVHKLADMVDQSDAQAIFFSCTNLRTFDILEDLEQALGKPVLSGNQVMMWAALMAAGIPLPPLGQRLFTGSPTPSRLAAPLRTPHHAF